jgi:hypothetical protein
VCVEHRVEKIILDRGLFYGFLHNTEFDQPVLRRFTCVDCGHVHMTLEVPVETDPSTIGAVVGARGQLRAVADRASLSERTLQQQADSAREAIKRQGRARRAIEDARIDREAEAKTTTFLGSPARRPGRKKTKKD